MTERQKFHNNTTMDVIIKSLRDYFLRLSLNQKLISMMLLLSLSLMSVYFILYFETEQAMYREFENQTAELRSELILSSSGSPPFIHSIARLIFISRHDS